MPLTTKKNGMKKPYPTAVSFDSNTWTSRPFSAIRAITPATNPPSSRSRPSDDGQRAEREDGDDRDPDRQLTTGLERALEQLPAAPDSTHGDHRRATTATTTKTSRITAFSAAPLVENTSVTSRIGPNSPIAPAASR